MKNYKAIYNTQTIKNCEYDFAAKNMSQARKFRKYKFSAKRVKLVQVD